MASAVAVRPLVAGREAAGFPYAKGRDVAGFDLGAPAFALEGDSEVRDRPDVQTASKIPAAPIPVPMHIVTKAYF